VLIAASVDGASGGFSWIGERYDCAPEWDYDCQATLP
jgi:hypothetical protein